MHVKSLDELHILEMDSNRFLSEREYNLRNEKVPYGVVRAFQRLAYQINVNEYKSCRNEMEVYLRKKISDGCNKEVALAMINGGVLIDGFLSHDWQALSISIKGFIRKYLNAPGLIFKGRPWEDTLDKLISSSVLLKYSPNLGYCLVYSGYLVGKDFCSIFIMKSDTVPVWRATLIEGQWVSTKGREENITI